MTASLGFTEPDKLEVTLANVLEKVINDEEMEAGYGILKHEEGIDLMPGNIELSGLEVSLVNVMSREIMLRSYVDRVKDGYDYILIDCLCGYPHKQSIKIFGQTVKSFRKFYEDIISYRDFTTKMTEVIRPGYVLFRMFVLSVATFIVPVGLLLFLKNPGDVAFVVTFLFFLILGPGAATPTLKLRSFSESMNIITEGVKRVDEVLNEKPLPEPAQSKIPSGHDISFRNVSFSYEAEGRKVLDNVAFTARQREITALVGPSGAGKSTIAELIPRFWDVTDGSIEIGGVDIRDMSVHDLMERMSFVFQESFLFSDTIFNNIAQGKPGATKEQVEQAAKAAQCHDFIMALPQGYQTKIGDDGVYLSGGEQQRVSIAKAILKNTPILILDEASAYADAENEHEMQLALGELIKSKTVIMIAHRLTTICNANQILVVAGGTIKECGTHEELLKQRGLYADMWEASVNSAAWTIRAGKEAAAE